MRTITLYTTFNELIPIETDVETFGELKPLIQEKSVSLENMKLTERTNKTVLENDLSRLPEGDTVIFMSKRDTKAGGVLYSQMSHNEVLRKISKICKDSPEAREFFNENQHFTRTKSSILRELLREWENFDMTDVENETPVKTSVESCNETKPENERLPLELLNESIEGLYHYLEGLKEFKVRLDSKISESIEKQKELDNQKLENAELRKEIEELSERLESVLSEDAESDTPEMKVESLEDRLARERRELGL